MTEFRDASRRIETPPGAIAYVGTGIGPIALFIHGAVLNSHLWRNQLIELSDIRRCIALDLLAHGDTEIASEQDLSLAANARMIREFLDALEVDHVDLVAHDAGGAIAQIFAAGNPGRIRSLTLTDCDTQGNLPPEAFKPFLDMAAAGGLRQTFETMLANKDVFRSEFAAAFEDPKTFTDDDLETYLRPLVKTETSLEDLRRFLASLDEAQVDAIEPQLRKFEKPTAIIWDDDDVFFDTRWSRWLAETIPGTRKRVELRGARLFFPWERPRGIQSRGTGVLESLRLPLTGEPGPAPPLLTYLLNLPSAISGTVRSPAAVCRSIRPVRCCAAARRRCSSTRRSVSCRARQRAPWAALPTGWADGCPCSQCSWAWRCVV